MIDLPARGDVIDLTVAPDGNVWFTVGQHQSSTQPFIPAIGKLTPSGGITRFPLPQPVDASVPSWPGHITSGPDGNLWFTLTDARIGRITPLGVLTSYPVSSAPWSITAGNDGNVWFTEPLTGIIGIITPDGQIDEKLPMDPSSLWQFQVETAPPGFVSYGAVILNGDAGTTTAASYSGIDGGAGYWAPRGVHALARGPSGELWTAGTSLSRIDANGDVRSFDFASMPPNGIGVSPNLAPSADGSLWYISDPAHVARLDPESGTVRTVLVSGLLSGTGLQTITSRIATAPNGDVWFTQDMIVGTHFGAYAWRTPYIGQLRHP